MIFASVATLFILYGIMTIFFIVHERVSADLEDSCLGSGQNNSSPVREYFVNTSDVALRPNQGWAGSALGFEKFHSQPPSATGLSEACEPENYSGCKLQGIASSYVLADPTKLYSMHCPLGHFCLLEAHYLVNERWQLDARPYPMHNETYPHQLSLAVDYLTKKKFFHLVVQGPASGTVYFTAIRFQKIYTFHRTRSPRHPHFSRSFQRTKSCPVHLRYGTPDGLLSLTPQL